MIEILLYTILSSFMFRFRGGLFGDYLKSRISWWGTTPVRLVWATFMSTPWLFYSFYLFLLAIPAWWIGILFKWSPWQYMENPEDDVPAMTFRGLVLTALPSLVLGYGINGILGVILFISGTLLGAIYGITSIILKEYTNYNLSSINEVSEWVFGAVIGLIVGLIFL